MIKLLQLKKDLLKYIVNYNRSKEKLQITKTSQNLSECSFEMMSEIIIRKNTGFK